MNAVTVPFYHDINFQYFNEAARLSLTHRHIFEQKVAPLILNVEEEAEDQCDVHDADEEDNNHSRVNGETTPRACLRTLMSHSSVK